MGEKSGAVAAISDLGTGAPEPVDHDDLFGDVAGPVRPAKRGRGRPAGSRNRSTEEWRKLLLAKYQSPLVTMLELASRTPRELAEELGIYEHLPVGDGKYEDRLAIGEAVKIQMAALSAALPYLHQKQPLAIEQRGSQRGVLVMGDLTSATTSAMAAIGLSLPLPDNEENQGVVEVTPEKSDAEKSDAQPNPRKTHEK